MIAASVLAALSIAQGQAQNLTPIFSLKREEAIAGNPLARYAELLRLESAYRADLGQGSVYDELRANIEEALGDEAAVGAGLAAMYGPYTAGADLESSTLDGLTPQPAVAAIVRAVGTRRAVMIGEEHHSPQSRAIVIPLLRALWAKGFRYYAAETFADDAERTQRQGYPDALTGTYTTEPVFGEAVREAIRLGYKLVPYEAAAYDAKLDPGTNQENRERGQALHLKERIFDRDPTAKVLVHGGRGHVSKGGAKLGDTDFRFMAAHFCELTGLDPFSIYCAKMLEHKGRPRQENPLYRYVTAKGWIHRPTVFVNRAGRPFSSAPDYDADVFFPRVARLEGRADWLRRDLGRRSYRLLPALLAGEGLRLVQARYRGEPLTAIPVDQALLRPGEAAPALFLPRGRFSIRTIDPSGHELGRVEAKL